MSSLTFGQQMAAAPVTPREGSTTASSEIENPVAYQNTRARGSGGARSVWSSWGLLEPGFTVNA